MKSLNYRLLSTYRTQLMGVAILWVIFYHATINVPLLPVRMFKHIGYGGVDIFLVVSGLGLYFSYIKCNSFISFYKRRALRILPTYLPIVLIFCMVYLFVGKMSLIDIFTNLTTISFWINLPNMFDWYIPSIISLYLLTPIFMHFFITKNKYITVTTVSLMGLLISIAIIFTPLSYLLIFTTRIPIFFIGFLVGYLIDKNKKITRNHFFIMVVMLILGLAMLGISLLHFEPLILRNYGLYWYPFILITIPLCLFMADFFRMITKIGVKLKFLSFCGKHSLEIYLLHQRILELLTILIKTRVNALILNLICFVLSLVLAYLLKKIVDKCISLFKNYKRMAKKEIPV